MKRKECTKLLACAAILVLMLFTPLAAFACAMGANPGVPEGYKTVGTNVKVTIVAGWKCTSGCETLTPMGDVDVYLIVEGRPYYGTLTPTVGMPLSDFIETEAAHITGWELPTELAALYNLSEVSLVKVIDEKNVMTDVFIEENNDISIPYDWILSCEVKITFLEWVGIK